jgi:hypothetical protein
MNNVKNSIPEQHFSNLKHSAEKINNIMQYLIIIIIIIIIINNNNVAIRKHFEKLKILKIA